MAPDIMPLLAADGLVHVWWVAPRCSEPSHYVDPPACGGDTFPLTNQPVPGTTSSHVCDGCVAIVAEEVGR